MVGELVLLNVDGGETDGVGSELRVILELAPKEIEEGGVGDDVSLPVAVKEDV